MTTTRRERRGEQSGERRGFIQGLTALCVRYVERLMPDPYLFAVILTLIVVLLVALLVRGATASGRAFGFDAITSWLWKQMGKKKEEEQKPTTEQASGAA